MEGNMHFGKVKKNPESPAHSELLCPALSSPQLL